MRKVFFWLLGLVLVGIGWLYQFGGLKYYLHALVYMRSLSGQELQDTRSLFYNIDGPPKSYTGILAGIWGYRVWVWGKDGLRPFLTDYDSTYLFTDGCSFIPLHPPNQLEQSFEIKPEVYFSLDAWKSKIRSGDFVSVLIATPDNGGNSGNLRQAFGYNWWYFMNKDIQTECAR